MGALCAHRACAAHEQPRLQRRQVAAVACVVDQAQDGAHNAAIIAARTSESSTATYLSVVAIEACPSSTCTARRLRVPGVGAAGEPGFRFSSAKAAATAYRVC
jgi:hypothetical protein